jgi:SAM-dependent methyltransferase
MAVENTGVAGRSGAAGSSKPGFGYRLLYFLGFTPWDTEVVPPELVELVEGPQALPIGRALDLGCGRGTQAIYLARHGWQVTGVDYVGRALETARHRAAYASVAPRWVEGDVTRLPELGLGGDYDLLFDSGCFHGLNAAQRLDYAAGATSVAKSGAAFLLFSFAPGRRGPAPRGVDEQDLLRYFAADWDLLWTRPALGVRVPPFIRRANPTWRLLRRR